MLSYSCRSFQDSIISPASATPKFLELVEVVPSVVCSFFATSYVVSKEAALPLSTFDFPRISHIVFPAHVPHGLLLGSCLVLGCCVSSYRHRMREREPYQGVVFLIWTVWSVLVGWRAGCKPDTVLLGMVPWALIAAMLSSYLGHVSVYWLLSRSKSDIATVVVEGKKKVTFDNAGFSPR
ncbi:hypothetical protein F5Y19DRAFT_368827 [Xylariaceae sp. FL1651]|nr:hypothetical protein F5Y19DRAFT_368827 [Xylariaceae sp. FL1651]